MVWETILKGYAEITRFADREFYRDWWNSTNMEEFSRNWNKVVHEFLYRHVYLYCTLELKISKFAAQLTTFITSAIFHEMIVALLLREVKMWLFYFMLLQIPMIHFL
mmetsp:Transcript_851/g.778  ORF Transcript_851/g.778 Transcript_851/m.778 type:complete len:107 (+) Transcript_851:926-1246(+)